MCESPSRHFQPGEGPSRGLLQDCEIFAYLRITFVWSSDIQAVIMHTRDSLHQPAATFFIGWINLHLMLAGATLLEVNGNCGKKDEDGVNGIYQNYWRKLKAAINNIINIFSCFLVCKVRRWLWTQSSHITIRCHQHCHHTSRGCRTQLEGREYTQIFLGWTRYFSPPRSLLLVLKAHTVPVVRQASRLALPILKKCHSWNGTDISS